MPNVFVPIDSSLLIHSVTRLYLDGRFNNFVYQYYTQHLPLWQEYKNPADFVAHFQNSNDVWNGLVAFAAKDSINLRKVSADDRREIEDRIKAYLARFRWRTQGFYQVTNASDKVVIKAREVLEK